MPIGRKRVFVSFDFDNDKVLKDFIVGQSRLPDSPFEIADWSMKEATPQRNWETEARGRIKRADIVIVMLGNQTNRAPGVLKEVQMAKDENIPIKQIIGYRDGNPTPISGLGQAISWNWETLKRLFRP